MNIDLMCKYQADLFAYACEKKDCSSSIFIKQFAYSNLAKRMDDEAYIYSADDITKAYYSLTLEKKLNKGKQIYPLKIMSWIGYIMRYISYKYKYSTNYIYKKVKPRDLYGLYEAYHGLDNELAATRIIEAYELKNNRNIIDVAKKYYL